MHPLFGERAFASVIRAGDSRRFSIDLKTHRKTIVDAAVAAAAAGFQHFGPVSETVVKHRRCMSLADYSQALILRLVSKYVSRRFRVDIKNRDRIVRAVIEALTDSTPIYILRRDIASFYESIPTDRIRDRLEHGAYLSPSVRHYIKAYFDTFCTGAAPGLPRGISLSAVLAEMAMDDFDKSVRSLGGVYRYFRYSDDILVLSFQPPDSIEAALPSLLPPGMKFNDAKASRVDIDCTNKSRKAIKNFEYLGYKYGFSDLVRTKEPRVITVAVAERKLSRVKTRIFCAFKAYSRDGDFELLLDRLRFISGNFAVLRHGASAVKTSRQVKSGIYYNYKLCGTYAKGEHMSHSGFELKALDAFYYSLLKHAKEIGASLDPVQLRQLQDLSFFKGFALKFTWRFRTARVQEIKKVWRNV